MKADEIKVDEQLGELGALIGEKAKGRAILIKALQEIQNEAGYLPPEEMQRLSEVLGLSQAEIYSVASFYKMFYFTPRGRKVVKVCYGTACYVSGAKEVLHRFGDEFGVQDGETSEDQAVTLETVGCVGCCGLAPVITCNDEVVGEVDSQKTEELIDSIHREERQESAQEESSS